ncbi:MAG: DUF4157 domain-containing protein [Pseudomonadota bacterium]
MQTFELRNRTQAKTSRNCRDRRVCASGFAARQPLAVRQMLQGSRLQPRLTIGEANDRFEREAEQVADRVMRMPTMPLAAAQPGSTVSGSIAPAGAILRKGMNGQSCDSAPTTAAVSDEDEFVQPRRKGSSKIAGTLAPSIEQSLSHSADQGLSLDSKVSGFMEQRFAADFSDVHVHTGSLAAQLNETLQAEAFTSGSDVYFNSNRYQPDNAAGRHLLAHELTHVLQQRRSGTPGIQRAAASGRLIQGYGLRGFPAAKAALMKVAVPKAYTTVNSCSYPSWLFKGSILSAINNSRYDYKADLAHI